MSPAATRQPVVSVGPAVTAPSADALDELVRLTRRLRMPYLRRAAADVIPTARAQRWDPAEVVRVLLTEEVTGRDEATVRLRRRRAGFPAGKTFQAWDEARCSIPAAPQAALRSLEWVDRRENLCVCGPSGTGKSHFCEALGQLAIDTGRTVAWFAIDELGALVRRHRADDTVARAITRITRADLIVVDDIGMLPVGPDAAEGFYRLVDAAYERRSLAVSSNLHPAGFDELMPKTLATATVDRLLHHAHVCVTQGESFRLSQATSGKGVTPCPAKQAGRPGGHQRGLLMATSGEDAWPPRGNPLAATGAKPVTVDTAAQARRPAQGLVAVVGRPGSAGPGPGLAGVRASLRHRAHAAVL